MQTKDWSIHYSEAGEGHPLIMLHGSGPGASGWSNFAPNIGSLSRNFRVLAVDMPGWGDSDAATHDQSDHVSALLQFMEALELEKAALVGNSMGGLIALRTAALYPEKVTHLVTMGSPGPMGPNLFGPAGLTEGLKILIKGYKNPDFETMRELANVMTFDPTLASDEMTADRSSDASRRPDHLKNFLEGFGRPGYMPRSTADTIATISAPTLLLHGRDDRVVHYENSLHLCALIPDSRVHLINRCGHWVQLEHTEEFNATVHSFINQK